MWTRMNAQEHYTTRFRVARRVCVRACVCMCVCARSPATPSNKMPRFMRSQSLREHTDTPPPLARASHNKFALGRAWVDSPRSRPEWIGQETGSDSGGWLVSWVAFDARSTTCNYPVWMCVVECPRNSIRNIIEIPKHHALTHVSTYR